MARLLDSRIKVTGTLIAETPLHVGGIHNNPEVDLAVAVNGQGNYYVPGTSLAGALRGWMQTYTNQPENVINALWGWQPNNRSSNGHASFILVEDALIQGAVLEIRDGVGIDRFWGTAADRVKYDRAILTRGSKIYLNLTFEVASLQSSNRSIYQDLFFNLIGALQQGEIRLGAAKTRGLGRVKLQNLKIIEQDLLTHQGILTALRGQGNDIDLAQVSSQLTISNSHPKLEIEIKWTPQSPIMVKAEGDGIAVDSLPLVSAVDSSVTFVLPGSAIKGVLRSQAERIVRTVCNLSIANHSDDSKRFIQQVEVALVQDIFGAAAKTENKAQDGRIGALFVDDCYAKVPLTPNAWESIRSATTETNLRQALNQANLTHTQQAFHVAVDRWTGGAADGFLYSTLEPMGITWQPLRLSLSLARLKSNSLAGVALLLLLLRDLSQGRIPLGYATNRGMGAIKVNQVSLRGHHLDSPLASLTEVTLNDGSLADLNPEFSALLNQAWQQWINTDKETSNV